MYRDPTLDAVDAAIEERGNAQPHRPYLGMSEIGRSCTRALWYGFRWCSGKSFDAATLKRFADGHRGEDIQAARLRLVDGITLHATDPRTPGKQFGYRDIGGHFRGHMDGVIRGLLQAPTRWHVWEHKQVAEKKQKALVKAIAEQGEKGALRAWDGVYYDQAVLYMHYADLDRHYLTCASAGGRHTVSTRTNADPERAAVLIGRAQLVINSPVPLAKVSDKPDGYSCRWCDHQEVCHRQAIPVPTCRTCSFSRPLLDGDGRWRCDRYGADIDAGAQRMGGQCPAHYFFPDIVPWEVVRQNGEWVEYRKPDGAIVRNGPSGYASREIAANAGMCGDAVVDALKGRFDAEVVG
jgi:hypothetical protein